MSSTLNNSPAEIIQQLIIDGGVGGNPLASPIPAWPIYATNEPTDIDNILVVHDTVGKYDGRLMVDGSLQEHHGFQIAIRSSDHRTGWVKANAIKIFLSEIVNMANVTIGASKYIVWCISNIQLIDVTGKQTPTTKCSLITINATVPLRQIA